jgi:CheY-like chemotaxis protein
MVTLARPVRGFEDKSISRCGFDAAGASVHWFKCLTRRDSGASGLKFHSLAFGGMRQRDPTTIGGTGVMLGANRPGAANSVGLITATSQGHVPATSIQARQSRNQRGVVIFPTIRASDPRDLIALVDDDDTVLEATASLLRSLGYTVRTFQSGRAFLGWTGLSQTTCLIADVMMPEIDGYELLRRLVTRGRRFPVIFLTAVTEPSARRRLLDNGAHSVLAKPCSQQTLIDCIESAIDHHA